MGMHLPDFRASERTFQLLEQVAGRAGRGERPGRVLVQTYNAQHAAMQALVAHDYDGFARRELEERRAVGYPPFTRMAAVRVDGENEAQVQQVAQQAAGRARAAGGDAVRVRGPAEAPIPRIKGRVRWQVWLSSTARAALAAAAEAAAAGPATQPRGVRLAVDVDPQSVL
jgi:primosomal protein N' (replication factor Y)